MTSLCRDCLSWTEAEAARCPSCRSPRRIRHPELGRLGIAHIDCDAFYAAVEKRENPSLADRPVIVGGGARGVVTTACYVARLYGVRSAMPMFKALKACPEAIVIPPNMAKYQEVGREVRRLMREATPLVEPLSIDEAFLDLTGTDAVHRGPPALTLAKLARRIEREIGITVSIGLSYAKFLAKVASDLDKPRGFAVIGRAEARSFLASRPVSLIWGVGPKLQERLAAQGIMRIGQLQDYEERELVARFGAIGHRLYRFARGEDDRTVSPDAPTKSISAETTFSEDHAGFDRLKSELRPLCETVARRLKAGGYATKGVVLKLKTADFKLRTRARALPVPTQLAEIMLREASALLTAEADGTRFRLIGIGAQPLVTAALADPPDLFDRDRERVQRLEIAMEDIRARMGRGAVGRGAPEGAEN